MKKVYQELPICTSLLLSKLSEVLIFCDCPAPKMNSWGGTTRSGREKMEVALMLLKAGTGTWSSIFGKLKVNDCALREWEYEMEGLGPSIDPNSFLSYSCSCWYTAETHCKNVRKVRDEILPMSKWDFILVKHNRNRRNMDSYRSLNLKGKTVLICSFTHDMSGIVLQKTKWKLSSLWAVFSLLISTWKLRIFVQPKGFLNEVISHSLYKSLINGINWVTEFTIFWIPSETNISLQQRTSCPWMAKRNALNKET